MLVVVAGIHGNERAGITAAQRVLAQLPQLLLGELIVLAGNVGALEMNVRYRDRDLNRVWGARPALAHEAEHAEQRELDAALLAALAGARGPAHLLDLHTTSAPGIPFLLAGSAPAQARFASGIPIPAVRGLEEKLEGILTGHFAQRGFVTLVCEGGQHEDAATVESLQAVLWLALKQLGLVAARAETERAWALLDERRAGLPLAIDVLSRHAMTAEDRFVMEPGFRNIEAVRKGRLLARDVRGEIRAPEDGVVVMPLYQGQGGDGFFWGRAA